MKPSILEKVRLHFKRDCSLNAGLRKIIGRKRLNELLERNLDWRELPSEAGVIISEAHIMIRLAEYFEAPYLPRVSPININTLPPHLSIDDFRRLGCIPRQSGEAITGFICVDPKRAEALFKGLPYGLAAWSSIREALNESEVLHRVGRREEQQKKSMQLVEAAKQALQLVISQAKTYSCSTVAIEFSNGAAVYSFTTAEGKSAKGVINQRVFEPLLAILNRLDGQETATLDLPGQRQSIKVQRAEDRDRFSISVIEYAAAAPENVRSFPDQPLHANPKKVYQVLIVDDNRVFAKVLEKFLERLNIFSIHAANGAEALAVIKEAKNLPDLVICDLHMPLMNGSEFVRRTRGELKLADLPIIILTSDDEVESELQLLTEGADAFVAKNEDPRLLSVKVQKLIQRNEARRAA